MELLWKSVPAIGGMQGRLCAMEYFRLLSQSIALKISEVARRQIPVSCEPPSDSGGYYFGAHDASGGIDSRGAVWCMLTEALLAEPMAKG